MTLTIAKFISISYNITLAPLLGYHHVTDGAVRAHSHWASSVTDKRQQLVWFILVSMILTLSVKRRQLSVTVAADWVPYPFDVSVG